MALFTGRTSALSQLSANQEEEKKEQTQEEEFVEDIKPKLETN